MPASTQDAGVEFRRAFYEAPQVPAQDVEESRRKLGIRIDEDPSGVCPPPIASFEELGVLPEYALRGLRDQGITKPMAIQAQALPLVLSGQDVIGLAQTGSGKTLSFLLPAVTHMEAQRIERRDPSPIVLVLAPTRELAVQIAEEAEKLLWHSKDGCHRGGLYSVCLYGGGNKRDQKDKLRQGGHVVVATPGRLLDFVESGVVSLRKVTYFVLDEADRMLDLGFLGDVTSISSHIRSNRQVLFFSATWGSAVQELATGLCDPCSKGPVRISSGQASEGGPDGGDGSAKHQAREGIEQRVVVVEDPSANWKQQATQKMGFLERHVRNALESSEDHKVLVFVSQKQMADDLANTLCQEGFSADSMHGGKSQEARLWVLDQFRKGELRLLICTDVLGRGIDLPNVSHVVIYEMGAIEDYIHRIGRTGRGPHGKGQALVFFEYWDGQPELASELIDVLRASDQPVPDELRRIAAEVASGKRGSWAGDNKWSSGGQGGDSWSRWGSSQGGQDWWNGRNGSGAAGGYKKNSGSNPAAGGGYQKSGGNNTRISNAPDVGSKSVAGASERHQEKPCKEKLHAEVPEALDTEEVPDSWDD